MLPDSFHCFLVKKTGKDQIEAAVETRPLRELPAGDVLIRVAYSSVNYKDALAANGHPGVARVFPHIPGIDAAGTVVESGNPAVNVGDQVLVTSFELGVERWGGWAEFVRVPGDWLIPLPPGLSTRESMVLGTAGLTAGLCVQALLDHDVQPGGGPVVVTGATGGVGSLAIALLAKLGYEVVAVSGKPDRVDWLVEQGAARVVGREELMDASARPLLKAQWGGVVDTVGGKLLASLLRAIKNEGCVAACGLVGGTELATTVYPFILRGITLRGVDSAWCPMQRRGDIWRKLASSWKLETLDAISQVVELADLPTTLPQLMAGEHVGRSVVKLGD